MNIETEYRGGKITYRESTNTWHATLDEAEVTMRGVGSLASARESLDRVIDKEEVVKKKFTRRAAWKIECDGAIKVEVTSPAEGYSDEWWISRSDTRKGRAIREKTHGYNLRADTEANRKLIEEMAVLRTQIQELQTKRSSLANSLEKFKLEENAA